MQQTKITQPQWYQTQLVVIYTVPKITTKALSPVLHA